ncbi:MAG TPA: c-type cytochrome [Thermoanaerobaculia bacterium]|nr:c-type cytochrome [Thermoanaerobaculia bacterium]
MSGRRRLAAAAPGFYAAAALALCAAGALAVGCAAAGAGAGPGLDSVPASAPARIDPYAGSRDGVAAGRKLFLRHCAECHGENGRGSRRAPAIDSERVRQAAPGALFWFLTNGRPAAGMPGWSRLPAARRWQIIAYLQAGDGHESQAAQAAKD